MADEVGDIDNSAEGRLKEAGKLIDMSQPLAARVLIEAMKATKLVPQIVDRDKKGAPIYEYVEVPDHSVRVRAAEAMLNKRIPDLTKSELSGDLDFQPFKISREVLDDA